MMDESAPSRSNTTSAESDDTDDVTLLTAIAAGDQAALRTLYNRHKIWMARRLRQRMSVDGVEEVLQETFFAVWRGAARYRSSGDVGAWIWGIARRQAALWARAHGKSHLAIEFLAEHHVVANDDPARTAVNRVDLQRAFASLGPVGSPMREVARQAFIEDRAVSEIARSLDLPDGTVKSRIFTLRKKLSAAVGKEHTQ